MRSSVSAHAWVGHSRATAALAWEQRGGEDARTPAGAATDGTGQAAPRGGAVAAQVLRRARPARVAGTLPGHGEPADRGAGRLRQAGTDPAGEGAWRLCGLGAEA